MSEKHYEYKPLEFDGDDGEGMEVWVEWDGNYFPARLRQKRGDSYWCFFPEGVPWGVVALCDYELVRRVQIFTRHEVEEPEQREPQEWWMNVTSMRCYTLPSPLRPVLVREVLPPVVKELPDRIGVWIRLGTTWTVHVSERVCTGKLEARENGDQHWREVERLPNGNWLFVTPLIERASKDAGGGRIL